MKNGSKMVVKDVSAALRILLFSLRTPSENRSSVSENSSTLPGSCSTLPENRSYLAESLNRPASLLILTVLFARVVGSKKRFEQ